MRSLPVLAAVLLVAAAPAPRLVAFPNATPGRPLAVPAELSVPAGPGPHPAVVLLHTCHGVTASTREWAGWFRDRGYVALVVDSWTPRGLTETCAGHAPEIPSTERFDDAVGALRYLHELPGVDRERIGVVGWSNGGLFAMALVNGPTHARAGRRGVVLPAPGFRAAVALYPGGCYSLVHEHAVRPLLVLIGDADDWTDPAPCAAMAAGMRARGADVTLVRYPGAHHYFDVTGLPVTWLPEVANRNRPGGCCGATVGHHPAAAADARRRIEDFFGYHLGR